MEKTLAIINEMKKSGVIKDYAIAGDVGAIYYIETILTHNLDIFFTYKTEPKGLEILKLVYEYLMRKNYKKQEGHIVIEGVPVQFFPVYDKLSKEAVECARKTKFKGVNTRVLSAEHFVAIMVQVFRPRDKERIIMLLDLAKVDKRRLNGILRQHNLTKKYNEFMKLHGKK